MQDTIEDCCFQEEQRGGGQWVFCSFHLAFVCGLNYFESYTVIFLLVGLWALSLSLYFFIFKNCLQMLPYKTKRWVIGVGEAVEKWDLPTLTLENTHEAPKMLNIELLRDPHNLLLGLDPREIRTYVCTRTCTHKHLYQHYS